MSSLISIKLDMRGLDTKLADIQMKLKAAVGKAMGASGQQIRESIQSHVASRMRVQKAGFKKSFGVRLLKGNDLPALRIGSKIRWIGIHEYGGSIGGKMLIPINGRVGRKQFKAYVDQLMRGGNAYFIRKGSQVILMAQNIKEHDRPLAGFKRRYRKAEGIKRLKRGADIPIAVLVSAVSLKKRLDIHGVVARQVPKVVQRIDTEIGKIR